MAERTGQRQRVTMTWESDPDQIITFDATPREDHSGSAEMTDVPIEGGGDPTDHIRRLKDELTLEAVITDDPLVVDRSTNATAANTGGDPAQRAVSAYDFLTRSKDAGKLFRVFTTLRDYRNMAINTIKVSRTAEQGRVLRADIFLREILVAVTEQVDAPVPAATARKRKRKLGKQNHKEETGANKKKGLQSHAANYGGDAVDKFLAQGLNY